MAELQTIWILSATALVLLMQGGFLLLEAGATRSRNSINVAQKNLSDFVVSVVLFYAVGFGLMFGPSLFGWIGTGLFAPGLERAELAVFFVFQAVFVGTAATICSGSVAERMDFMAYLVMVAALGAVIYPVVGHWVWGNLWIADNAAWLADRGFMDFAGGTVVHSTGAWAGLAGIILLGARQGKFAPDGTPRKLNGHSGVLASCGVVMIWVGWIGFNGGGTAIDDGSLPGIIAVTFLGATSGGSVALITGRIADGLYSPMRLINGSLAGLVAITAGVDVFDARAALICGGLAGGLVICSEYLLEHKLKLDDVIGAVSVHGICGVFGTLMIAALAPVESLVLGSRVAQFQVQLLGVSAVFGFVFGGCMLVLIVANLFRPIRVSEAAEREGLNSHEHGASLGTGDAQRQMSAMMSGHILDLSRRFDTAGGDEAADMAHIINPFLDRIAELVARVQGNADRLQNASGSLVQSSRDAERTITRARDVSGEVARASSDAANLSDQTSRALGEVGRTYEHITEIATTIADELREVARTVEGFDEAAGDIAGRAQAVNDRARSARDVSGDMEHGMQRLIEATNSITGIAEIIRDIAFRTHMLSINASVEAARSGGGEQSGFAVVAREVRELARQTNDSVDDIVARLDGMNDASAALSDHMGKVSGVVDGILNAADAILGAVSRQKEASAALAGRMQDMDRSVAGTADTIRTSAGTVRDAVALPRSAAETLTTTRSDMEALAEQTDQAAQISQAAILQSGGIQVVAERLSDSAGRFGLPSATEDRNDRDSDIAKAS